MGVTESDRDVFKATLKEARSRPLYWVIAHPLYHLKELGIPEQITYADEQMMDRKASEAHGLVQSAGIVESVYYAKMMGRNVNMSDEEKVSMVQELGRYRREGKGLEIALQHFYIRGLSKPEEVTPEDQEAMKKRLGEYRAKNNGHYIALMHHLMRRLGVETKITHEDRGKMEDALTIRRQKGDIFTLLPLLYYLNDIKPPLKPVGEQTPTPPIKEYGRR